MNVRLSQLGENEGGVVVDIVGGPRARSKLTSIGIVPGARVRVLRINPHGPIILAVDNARFAIGRGLADKVIVRRAV
ncbi:FeoA family protein [Palaeococcus ferrophilus]|uniref:FeoA family protein n=1 Tax=Palaeococcus ferrophilus TaxID=83868 RepID=UPI00064F541C|nr:FeoA domain-containing protein [Palaeococcus ferrophilus]